MRYNVAQFLMEPVGSQWDFQVNEEAVLETGVKERVQGHLQLTHFNKSIWARAELDVEVDEVCGRCLKSFRQPIHASIDETFQHAVTIRRDEDAGPPEAGDVELFIDESDTLDLREVLRQYLILNHPVKSLCRPDCKGICLFCGSDRNLNQCQCQKQSSDPRWARLVALGSRSGEQS